jgi:hypothetical protein
MAHFHPLRWEIDLSSYQSAELGANPVVQGVFVHEYVHYVQALTGTIGRHILIEMARIGILAGLSRRYGWPPPEKYEQIYLREVLEQATKANFMGSEAKRQYDEFATALAFATSIQATTMPKGTPLGVFKSLPLTVGPHTVPDFVHVTGENASGVVAVPVTDRVVFENMARQVQRNYLLFNNNLKTAAVDDERINWHRDLQYVCLHDVLKNRLPESESTPKWTITLCQIAILCRNPGTAFVHMFERVSNLQIFDLGSFVDAMNSDDWFKGEFNEPPIQGVLNDLIQKWGSAILPRENWEMRELTILVANASNALLGNYGFMASDLLTWKDVGGWIARFGCPPIHFADRVVDEVQGIKSTAPWTWYLQTLNDLLG